MSYEILNRAYKRSDGQVIETTVDLRQNDPYTLLTRKVDGDHTNTSDKKLIEIVLQIVNEETTPKAVLIENIKELKEQVREQQETVKQVLETNEVLSNAFEELTFVVFEEVLPQLQEKEVIDATPIEDIAQPIEVEKDEEVGE